MSVPLLHTPTSRLHNLATNRLTSFLLSSYADCLYPTYACSYTFVAFQTEMNVLACSGPSSTKANNALKVSSQQGRSPSSSNRHTISKVQTRRIQIFSLPSTPSTSSSSTPSHQHLRAGFLQNNNNFWAMPTALLPAKSPLTSVRNLANARLHMTALLGSPARCPHRSSYSKPLYRVRQSNSLFLRVNKPCSQHFDEMLLGRPSFVALLEPGENTVLPQ